MANAISTWRKHPFVVGLRYLALQDFPGWPTGRFTAGESYRLKQVAYSHYDSCSVFLFQAEGSTEQINRWWHDEEPATLCTERFAAEPDLGITVEPL